MKQKTGTMGKVYNFWKEIEKLKLRIVGGIR
jgi:hypothetical protein